MRKKHVERFLEFLVVGVVLGVTEDLLAVKFATGEPLTLRVIVIVFAVSLPFAAFSELFVDRQDFAPDWLLEKFS
ncbi:MAG: hypothetical protein ABEJ98_02545 [Candidatus Nanohaloarchaea archaeon]